MRRATLLLTTVAALGCERREEAPTDTAAAAATPAARTIALSDVAGTWEGETRRADNDSVTARWTLNVGEGQAGWSSEVTGTSTPPARSTTRSRSVVISGDSIIVESEPFASVVRRGQQVTTRTVYRVQDGRLTGTIVARYPGGDTLVLRSEGTRR